MDVRASSPEEMRTMIAGQIAKWKKGWPTRRYRNNRAGALRYGRVTIKASSATAPSPCA